ncbi:DUF4367 domain-containing protein [Selenomonas sp. oral taxon 136]|uniref:DUF4367 domain-containing protein n=1 Tax=Selenomonas sp. oral taxon 136 TaxID=713030 RepID=UPI000A636C1B|nr:DUF4367 domain-containing protein [Selenomonas sp. oral taxon 136]
MKYNDVKRLMMAGLIASCAALATAAEAMPTAVSAEPMVGMPSPLVEYPSVRDAWAVAGLPVYTPTLLPVGYAQKNVIAIDKSLAEIFYRNSDGKEILFRMAAGNADISGDSTAYEVNQVVQAGRQYIRVKGSGRLVHLALWSRGGYTFSLSFEEPVSVEAVEAIVTTIAWN